MANKILESYLEEIQKENKVVGKPKFATFAFLKQYAKENNLEDKI